MVFGLCSGRGKLLFIVLGEPRGSTGLGSRSVVQFSFEMFIIGMAVSESSRCDLPDSAGFC